MKNRSVRPDRFDWTQFKILLSTSIRLDFRSSRGMLGRWKRIPPIWGSVFFYGLMGTSLAGGLLLNATSFSYTVLIISYSMVMVAFAVMLEYEQTILQPEDETILGPLPVSSQTVRLARFSNLVFYAILVGTSICFVPSILGLLLYESLVFSAAFVLMSALANLFSAFLIAAVYAWLIRFFSPERFRDALVYIQTGLTFLIILLYQLLPRAGDPFSQAGSDRIKGWLFCVPPAWFAGAVQYLSGSKMHGLFTLFLTAVLGFFFISLLALQQFSVSSVTSNPRWQSDEKQVDAVNKSLSVRPSRMERWIDRIFQSSELTAGFQLTLHLIKRDRSVKMGLYPVFGIPLAFLVLALLEGGPADPFVSGPFAGGRGTTAVVVFFVFFMVYFFIAGIVYIRDWEAGWIYQVAPIGCPGQFFRGVKLVIFLRLLLPFFILLGVVYSARIPWIHGVRHALSLFLLGLVASSMVSLFLKDYPFSKKREKGERMHPFGFMLFVLPFFGIMLAVQLFVYQDSRLLWLIQCGLAVLYIVLESIAFRRLDKVLKSNSVP